MNQPISDIEARIYERLEQARGDKGLKPIIAYRTGLDIDPGMMALDKIRRAEGGVAMRSKTCATISFAVP